VAVGGDLEPARVLDAYAHGVFPWYEARGPLLWWCPDPRAVLPLDGVHVSRRLRRTLRSACFDVTVDRAFGPVIRACARARRGGTWIHREMIACYEALHAQGHAHSLEVWRAGELAGGVYGVTVGGVFAAESMFHHRTDASKVALVRLAEHLAARGYGLLDVQFLTGHLQRQGAIEIPRSEYLRRLAGLRGADVRFQDVR